MLYILCIIIIVFIVVVVMFQILEVIVTSLGYYWYSGDSSQSPNCWNSSTSGARWVQEEMEGVSDIVIEDVCGRMAH